ncbi:E3 ubiquitin-protein ligase TRIM71-like [Patiria miniata]|uniref:Uncharacterized protein n=1 Tax=Patiria miniata TaxID=46514 RepID=A0A914BNV6_PATMI|nr:E3 ubiquitin-protein ligase TRIM71-like [Patiria miniata]
MATGGITAESILGSIIQGHLECSICHTRYQEPKMLDCSHSFCLRCLQELKKSQKPKDDKIRCPLCQRETILPEGGVAKLTTNYGLISLVEEVTKQEQLLKGEVSKVICQACDEENEAISHCADCELLLCQDCQKAHQRFNAMKSHKITPLSEAKHPKASKKSDCEIHTNRELSLYCNTCEKLICKQCVATNHNENTHCFFDLDTAFDMCMEDAHKGNLNYKTKTSVKIARSCQTVRQKLTAKLAETNSQISKIVQEKLGQIRREEKQLRINALATYRRKDKRLAEMEFAEQAKKMVGSETTKANKLELLKLRQDLLHDYRDVVEEQSEDVTHDISFLSLKENRESVSLGKLLTEEKWALATEISQVTGNFIAAFSTGDMVVADNNSRSITKLSPNGEVLYVLSRNTVEDFVAMAVNKDDHLILLTQHAVEFFSKDFQLLHQFKTQYYHAFPTGLAVDDDNLIALAYKTGQECVKLFRPSDGYYINSLEAPKIDKHFTISNKQFTYTNREKNLLASVDFQGNKRFVVELKENFTPRGVCCDKVGDIYILMVHELAQSCPEIHKYNMKGNFIKSFSITWDSGPCDITYTPDNKLAVICTECVLIYQRV